MPILVDNLSCQRWLFDEGMLTVYLEKTTCSRPRWPDGTKEYLFGLQAGVCAGCRRPKLFKRLQLDHFWPFAWGGPTTLKNGQLLCGRCNKRKGDRPMCGPQL